MAGILISGYVLLASQKHAIETIVVWYLKGRVAHRFDLKVLTDLNLNCGIGWGYPRISTLNVYSRPQARDAWVGHAENFLSSQTTTTDPPFRILLEENGWQLVQLYDLTLGWVQKEHVNNVASATGVNARVSSWRVVSGNHITGTAGSEVVEHALQFLGVTYVLGGTTKSGIDCSGLVQRAYESAFGTILPKHSREQLKVGRAISFDNRLPGDIIFFSRSGTGCLHVGLLSEKSKVIHASSRYGLVKIEGISSLLSLLGIVQIRRVVHA